MRGETDTTTVGCENRNKQIVIEHTDRPGNDHYQYLYVLRCTREDDAGSVCGYRYAANGSDIWERNCPRCQNGEPGPPLESPDEPVQPKGAHIFAPRWETDDEAPHERVPVRW